MTHEEELVRAFIDPRRKERYLGFIASPKLRKRFLQELAHFKHLDIRYAKEVNLTTAQLAALLKEMRVPDVCWVVSENPKIDGKLMPVSAAVAELGRDMGTFLSFVPDKLAYFEDEDGRWMLQHP